MPQLITKGCTCRSSRSVDSSAVGGKEEGAADGGKLRRRHGSSFFIIDRPIDIPRYSAFRTRCRVVLRAGGPGQHVRDEFRRSRAGQHRGPRVLVAEPRRTSGKYARDENLSKDACDESESEIARL